MDRYSIVGQSSSLIPAPPATHPPANPHEDGSEPVRFPGEDGGKSLSETARDDLDAALQLLVERAKYITGALAATISLFEDGHLICHACTGAPKQKTGVRLMVESGLAAESVRTRRILRCNDTSVDVRTNSEACQKYGISSAMVMPLARGPEVVGVFELLSGMPQAFEERDLSALARLGEMVETAMDHADAAGQAPSDTFFEEELPAPEIGVVPLKLDPLAVDGEITAPAARHSEDKQGEAALIERGTIGSCQACGFPVSGHRRLCVDCGANQPSEAAAMNGQPSAPSFLAHSGAERTAPPKGRGSAGYTVGAVVALLATAAVIVWMKFPEVPAWIMQHAHLPH